MGQLKAVAARKKITFEDLIDESTEGVSEAIEHLREIASNPSYEPRDRIAASSKLIDSYSKLASLVEIDESESLPILKALNGSRK